MEVLGELPSRPRPPTRCTAEPTSAQRQDKQQQSRRRPREQQRRKGSGGGSSIWHSDVTRTRARGAPRERDVCGMLWHADISRSWLASVDGAGTRAVLLLRHRVLLLNTLSESSEIKGRRRRPNQNPLESQLSRLPCFSCSSKKRAGFRAQKAGPATSRLPSRSKKKHSFR